MPGDAPAPDAWFLSLDLYVEEPVLATTQPRRIREAGVGFGYPRMRRLAPDHTHTRNTLLPANGPQSFVLLQFPFELEVLASNCRYQSASVTIEFIDDRVSAADIRAQEPTDRPTEETVRFDIRGVGRNRVAWDLHPLDTAAGLRPRSHVVEVVMDVPADTTELSGSLSAHATIVRRRIGVIDRLIAASIAPKPFTLAPLPPAADASTAVRPRGYPGPIRFEVCRRMQGSWKDLADYLEVARFTRDQFDTGHEASALWDLLEAHGRLGKLSAALRAVGRGDLADLLDAADET